MVILDGVEKRFGVRLVVSAITLAVPARASIALLGPSGCGKSTLLRLILGLLVPDRGRVSVAGTLVTPDTATRVRRQIGYVIQDGGLFPHLTARENVTLLARHLRWEKPRLEARAAERPRRARLGAALPLPPAGAEDGAPPGAPPPVGEAPPRGSRRRARRARATRRRRAGAIPRRAERRRAAARRDHARADARSACLAPRRAHRSARPDGARASPAGSQANLRRAREDGHPRDP